MGGMLTHPETEKSSDQGEGLGLRYGLSSMQGWRPEMEDAHDVKLGLRFGLDDWSFFAVFDGHAGKCTAAYAAWNLLDYILRDNQFELATDNWSGPVHIGPNGERVNPSEGPNGGSNLQPGQSSEDTKSPESENKPQKSDTNPSANKLDDEPDNAVHVGEVIRSGETSSDAKTEPGSDQAKPETKFASYPVCEQLSKVKNAIKSGFLNMDQSMRSTAQDMSGCTAICALISPTHLFIANCGDSRAVFYDGITKFVTEDHKPFNPKERRRIIAAGGTATQRVNGTLAVSRALGDFEFKKDAQLGPCDQIVSPEPEVTVITRQPQDEFLILACDGIWDVMNNDDLCQFVRYKLKLESSLEKICSSVLDVCLRKGSKDNMSIIIVVFENGPRVSEEEILKDKNNDDELLRIANQVIATNTSPITDFSLFLSLLKDELWGTLQVILPPGAGIEAKYDLLHEWFDKNFAQQENQDKQEDIENVG